MSGFSIGCALWTLGATPDVQTLARQMEIAAEIGCTSVQPWIVNVEFSPCILDPEVGSAANRREIVKIAESLGVSFSATCAQLQGATTYGGLEEEEGLRWRIDKSKEALKTTAELGWRYRHDARGSAARRPCRSNLSDAAAFCRRDRGTWRQSRRVFCARDRSRVSASAQ